MGTMLLDAETVARTRLACSPAMECQSWLRLAATGTRHPVFGDPGAAARAALAHPDVALTVEVLAPNWPSYVPDFLMPQPIAAPPADILAQQLADVAATGAEALGPQLVDIPRAHGGTAPSRHVRRLVETDRLARRIANGMAHFWRAALRDRWPTINAVLERDIAEKTACMGRDGVGHLLDTLHPTRVTRLGSSLVVGRSSEEVDLRGTSLVLTPHVSGVSGLVVQLDTPTRAVLYYRARGIGGTDPRRADRLAAALGSLRSALLVDLAADRSTSELAARHGCAPSTISYHLTALREAGLVTRRRAGRYVLYSRTRHATALLDDGRHA